MNVIRWTPFISGHRKNIKFGKLLATIILSLYMVMKVNLWINRSFCGDFSLAKISDTEISFRLTCKHCRIFCQNFKWSYAKFEPDLWFVSNQEGFWLLVVWINHFLKMSFVCNQNDIRQIGKIFCRKNTISKIWPLWVQSVRLT